MAIAVPGDFTLSYSAIVAPNGLNEARPKNVASRLTNEYLRVGPSGALQLSRFDDIGRADTVSAGTEYVTEAAVGSTSTTATPTRRAKMALIDIDTMRERVPGAEVEQILNVVQNGEQGMSVAQVNDIALAAADAMGPETRQILASHAEAREYDTTTLFSGLSRSVGTSTANMTVDNFEDGLYTLLNGESLPHRDIVACLDLRQLFDMRADARANETSTALNASILDILTVRPDLERQGLEGAAFGVPIYCHDSDVRVTANAGADVVGAIFLRGFGAPETDGDGQAGCFAYVQKHQPVLTMKWIPRASSVEIMAMHSFVVIERIDNWGVKVVTDAP